MNDAILAPSDVSTDRTRMRAPLVFGGLPEAEGCGPDGDCLSHVPYGQEQLLVHDIDLAAINVDAHLIESIAGLPGKRFVFTNGCRHHAERVLIRTGLTDFFEDIWDIRTTRFTPKPLAQSYDHILAHSGVEPRESAMFEDISRNLVPAHALGMTAVWVKGRHQASKSERASRLRVSAG